MKRFAKCGLVLVLLMFCMTVFAAAAETTTISGKLVSATGDPIKLTGTGGSFGFTNLNGASVTFDSQEVTLSADGTFSITVPDTTGQYKMKFSTSVEQSLNVLPNKNYFYAQDAGNTSKYYYHQGTTLDFSGGDISGLELVVDTGWMLTGTIKLGEGAILTSPRAQDWSVAWIWFGFRNSDEDWPDAHNIGMDFYKGESEWSYRMILPKTPASYTLMVDHIQLKNETESNLHTGKLDIAPVEINGDMTLPDIILKPARAEVTATFALDTRFLHTGDVYVATERAVYDGAIDSHYESSYSVPITIPVEDTSDTYQIYYEMGYDGSGSLVTGKVYVAEDGSLTTDASKAGNFPVQGRTHAIDPLKMPPFAEGRVYIPNYFGEIFYVTVGARRGNTTYAKSSTTVSQATVLLDEQQGRYYIPYSLASNQVKEGTTYYLYVTVTYDKGDSGRWNSGTHYADEDGGPVVEWPDRFIFTSDGKNTNELDVSLLLWDDGSEYMFVQGEHGLTVIPPNTAAYTASYPGAASLKVTFSYRTDVYLNVNGTEYTNSQLAGQTIEVTGDTLNIEYVDRTYSKEMLYGFAVKNIEPVYAEETSVPDGVVAVYSATGSDEATLLADLAAGNAIRVSLVHSEDVTGSTLAAAAYDGDGRLLDITLCDIVYTNGLGTAQADFNPCAGAADLRLMLLSPDACAPLMEKWTL